MKWIFLSVILLTVLLTGLGILVFRVLHIPDVKYHAPYGFIFLLAILQLLYYPVQLANGPFWIVEAATALALLACLYAAARYRREVFHELLQREIIAIAAAAAAFIAIFYRCGLDMEFSDATMYLNYISQNIGASHLNLFNLYTGKTGAEWDGLYLYQGYYHFVSAYVALLRSAVSAFTSTVPETIEIIIWGMGLLYSLISNMFMINLISSFRIESRFRKAVLALFLMGYLNLYYWKVAFAFYGNTYRSLCTVILMFTLWRWIRGEIADGARVLIPAIVFAGIACSSSFLFISFAVFVCLAAYLFMAGKAGSLEDLSIFILPMAVYASVLLSRASRAGYAFAALFLLYYCLRKSRWMQSLLKAAESFLCMHAKAIFLVILPSLCAAGSLAIYLKQPDYAYGYSYFFRNHQTYDMVKDYFFLYSAWYDNLVNAVMWAGIIVLFLGRRNLSSGQQYVRTTAAMMCLVFMNPLCTPAISYTIASNVFYRSWEVLFNPFMDLAIILYLDSRLSKSRIASSIPPVLLAAAVAVSNALPWTGDKTAAYGFYLDSGRGMNPLLKSENDAVAGIRALRTAIAGDGSLQGQPVIISQAEGTRVYIPQAYQLITARDVYYSYTRTDQELYQIGRRHHPWEAAEETHYEDTCSLLGRYQVNYLLIRYWENPEFDEAASACSVTIYQNSTFRLRRVISN